MAGSPKRRARKLATQAAELAATTGVDLDSAMLKIEAEQRTTLPTVGAAKSFNGGELPSGERHRLELEAARAKVRAAQAEWLIGTPQEIAEGYEQRNDEGLYTPATVERLLYLTRCGIPVKDSAFGPGSARQCGLSPATVWNWVHKHPAFGKAFREARDQSSEILEDEMRAMLPTAMTRPDLIESIEFIAGRLEWLAKARNPERYNPKRDTAAAQSITFNLLSAAPKPIERDVTAEGSVEKLNAAKPRTLSVSLPPIEQ